jgi:N-acetylmuramoyl-L-alanine amidase
MTPSARVSTAIVVAAMFISMAALPVRAQTDPPVTQPAETLFADASAKEVAVRKALATGEPLPTLLKAVRTVVSDYENVVRHYPTSGFCDDALWRAAKLARDAFEEFHEARERATALRLFQLLQSGYPSSRLVKQVPEQVAWLNASPAKAGSVVPAMATAAAEPAPPALVPSRDPLPPAGATAVSAGSEGATVTRTQKTATPVRADATTTVARLASIKGVRRAILSDVVRVTIELDGEVPFHDERLESPSRVFVDLPSTRANPGLIDQTIRFDADTDVVRQIRIGRHPNSTTRIVLEAAGVSSYSVYPLYSPFRLVIDCLRATPLVASNSAPAADKPPTPLPPRSVIIAPAPPVPSVVAESGLPPAAAPAPIDTRAIAVVPDPEPIRSADVETPAPVSPATNRTAKASDNPSATNPARPSASDRPVWAITLAKPVTPPVLPARKVRWVLSMPSGVVVHLPAVAPAPAPPDANVTAGLAKPLPPATATPPPAGEPAHNVNGGLSIARQLGLGVSRIVIDPGHGGHDPGAKGSDTTEAELVLDVALRLEKLLAKVQGVQVVLTRRENEFVPLHERTAIANREGADLFLSIHANASNVSAVRGVETYFLNFASNQNAAAVAARENATSDQTMGALQDVVKAIALNSKRDESRDFATYVQREMIDSLKGANKTLKDLGVKQAPFVVLVGASMPSVLAEISFITNPQEAKLLKSNGYRQRIAQALFDGIKDYQASLKNGAANTQQQD